MNLRTVKKIGISYKTGKYVLDNYAQNALFALD